MSHISYFLIGSFTGVFVGVLGKYFEHALWERFSYGIWVNILIGSLGSFAADVTYSLNSPTNSTIWEELVVAFAGSFIFLFIANFLFAAFFSEIKKST